MSTWWPPRLWHKLLPAINPQGVHHQLVPTVDDGPNTMQQSREQRSLLQRFDSQELQNVPEFKYKKLPPSQHRIRLLKLRSGTVVEQAIYCELVDAAYDHEFHIPTRVKVAEEEEARAGEESGGPGGPKVEKKEVDEKKKDAVSHKSCALCWGEEFTGMGDMEKEFEKKKEEKQKAQKALGERRKKVGEIEIKYEALSWCWGTDPPDYAIKIDHGGRIYKKRVTKALALALKYLRLPDRERILWVDAICINQEDDNEKNHQVQMMSRIYRRASEVAIWLGEDTDDSITAIDFIKNEIIKFPDFDNIFSDKKYSGKWRALMMLMQRDWFSRRWVVQEIALASSAMIYCGPDSIPWSQFAVAVELFVEVESATHQLSEMMRQDEKFRHVSGWFEHISEVGASLLVQATVNVFRAQRMPLLETHAPHEETRPDDEKVDSTAWIERPPTIDPLDRRSLLSLEYLVTTMFIFKAGEPRDAVYALLAIARDAAPFAKSATTEVDSSILTTSSMEGFSHEKRFTIDYSRSYSDVCRDFVEFAIKRKCEWDAVQSLDILCRPWALDPPAGSKSIHLAKSKPKEETKKPRVLLPKRENESWRILQEQHARVIVLSDDKGPKLEYAYPRTYKEWWKDKSVDTLWRDDKRTLKEYNSYTEGLVTLKEVDKYGNVYTWHNHPDGWEDVLWYFPPKKPQGKEGDKTNVNTGTQSEPNKNTVDVTVPSWVTLAAQAPFSLYYHPGVHVLKTGRTNADPLVGQPQDGRRNYSAAQTNPVDLNTLRFRKRQRCGHYSLYVRGFKLDMVVEVLDASQGGNIPRSWLDMAGWTDYAKDPPDSFWRTIVGDRGRDNRNPPYYYATACKESVRRGGTASGRVNTADLVNNERNSIVAEFCRRVQAVIWGRRLFRTEKGTLGLATNVKKGDCICILYGCSVPVILSENQLRVSKHEEIETVLQREEFDDAIEALRSCVQRLEKKLERKARYREKKMECPNYEKLLRREFDEAMAMEKRAAMGYSKAETRRHHNRSRSRDWPRYKEQPLSEETIFYKFKGETYLHGMMDGEALREKFWHGIKDTLFEIR